MQQTRIEQGTSYYLKFISAYPTVFDLADATEEDVLNNWQGLGYYSRARNLHQSAKHVAEELNGVFPETYSEILKLKGVGSYTAAAIASFAFNERKAVVDGNVYRFLSRAFDIATPIDSAQGKKEFQWIADELIQHSEPHIHNQAMMEMGSVVCKPKPDCENCPVQTHCLAFRNNTISNRPIKSKKTAVSDRYFHYLVYDLTGKTYIEKRTEKDIWQNLYQFPLIELKEAFSKPSIDGKLLFTSDPVKHILSHQRIHAQFHHISSSPKQVGKGWIEIDRASIQEYPLPRIIDRYLEKTNND